MIFRISEYDLAEIAKMGGLAALQEVGITAGEISQRQAYETYGRKFINAAVVSGRLRPVSIGGGSNGTIRYSINDILAIKTADRITAAQLQ